MPVCIWLISRPRFLFFFFSTCMNSNCTTHAPGFTVARVALGLLRINVFGFTFPYLFIYLFFLSPAQMNITALFMHMDSLCKRQIALFTGLTPSLFRKKIFKTGITALSTHLKIILLPCFQLSVF